MSDLRSTIEIAAGRWMKAWVDRDAATLERSLASDFVLVLSANPNQQLDRASWLATACTRYTASEFHYRDVQVREIGSGLAVMSSIADFIAAVDGVPRTGPLFLVDIWRRQVGTDEWQVCARYSSKAEPVDGSAKVVGTLSRD